MERVMIIGCGGAGKSTLARKLGEKTGLPVVHLDRVYWRSGWEHVSKEEFDAVVLEEMEKPRWILDGNFNRTLPIRLQRCDTVIYLDFNRFTCLFSWLGRVLSNWGKSRADMPEGCAEWFDPEFALWIWNFNKNHRAKYHAMLKDLKGKNIHILKNRRRVRRFLESV